MTNPHDRYPGGDKPTKGDRVPRQDNKDQGLPLWFVITSASVVLGLLAFNVLAYGPDGYPTTVVLGGLFGAIFGVDKLLKNRTGGK